MGFSGFFFAMSFLFMLFEAGNSSFDQYYYVSWGADHASNQGGQVQLSLDQSSGAGLESKQSYVSGFFNMSIKIPDRNSAGVVTAYYLTSKGDKHDELDFEFLGNKEGRPIYLQTNVFANGAGNKEQRITLWFDPTADFHTYSILWNPHQIVFYVDGIPIRVFKNKKNIGVKYPTQAMQVEGSLWNGESWATDEGKTKIDWNYAPFRASFKDFDITSACTSVQQQCNSWWNTNRYWQLDSDQQRRYENVRRKYMVYDYCSDTNRYPTTPIECPYNA